MLSATFLYRKSNTSTQKYLQPRGSTAMSKVEASSTDDSEKNIQVLKEATCPTTSGKSTLGYQIALDKSGEILFKLISNTGGGFFTSKFFSYSSVVATLESLPDGQSFNVCHAISLKNGANSNNAGFATALLLSLGILELAPGKTRLFQASDPSRFLVSVEELRKKAGISATRNATAKAKPKTKASAKAKAKSAPKAETPRKTR